MRNKITPSPSHVYISYICVTCVTLYKYINKNIELVSYTGSYTGVTQPGHCVSGEALA